MDESPERKKLKISPPSSPGVYVDLGNVSPQPGPSSLSDQSGPRSQNYANLDGCSSSEAPHGQSFSYDFVSDDGFHRDDIALAIKLSLQSENTCSPMLNISKTKEDDDIERFPILDEIIAKNDNNKKNQSVILIESDHDEEKIGHTDEETASEQSYHPDSQSSSDESDECLLHRDSKIKRIGRALWASVKKQKVKKVPKDIDGLVFYEVSSSSNTRWKHVQDGRPWGKSNRTDWSGYTSVRYFNCKGGYVCENFNCPFYKEYRKENKLHFENINGKSFCKPCGKLANHVECNARRYVAFTENLAHIYHYGYHSCEPKISADKPSAEIENFLKIKPNAKPSDVQRDILDVAIRDGESWDVIGETAKKLADRKWISNEIQKARRASEPDGSGYEAVERLKEFADQRDEFYIYRIDKDKGLVFKTSKLRLQFALNMDRDSSHFLDEEFCFFDGKVKRVKGRTSLTASVYHPLLRRQKALATMECSGESLENVSEFWAIFNQALSDYKGTPYIFNPLGWSTDNSGAISSGIKEVFGSDALLRVKSCEFHFKDIVIKKSNKFNSEETKEKFQTLAMALLEATTVNGYNKARENMADFISLEDESSSLNEWLEWWHVRRHFIFRAFAQNNGPRMNQAETIHAVWVNRGEMLLSLAAAAREDIKDSEMLLAEYSLFQTGGVKEGTGPSYQQMKRRNEMRELENVTTFGMELLETDGQLLNQNPTVTESSSRFPFVDPTSSYKPPDQFKGKTKKTKSYRDRGRSQEFMKSFQKAKAEDKQIKIKSLTKMAKEIHVKIGYQQRPWETAYNVTISTPPACTCAYFLQRAHSRICKHIIWVYLHFLKVGEGSDLIQQVRLSEDSVIALLSTAPSEAPDNLQFVERRKNDKYQTILRKHEKYNDEQKWMLTYKKGRKANCRGCKADLEAGSLCVAVEALHVPFMKEFAQEIPFFFCANGGCLKNCPPWTNLKTPEKVKVAEGVTAEHITLAKGNDVPCF